MDLSEFTLIAFERSVLHGAILGDMLVPDWREVDRHVSSDWWKCWTDVPSVGAPVGIRAHAVSRSGLSVPAGRSARCSTLRGLGCTV